MLGVDGVVRSGTTGKSGILVTGIDGAMVGPVSPLYSKSSAMPTKLKTSS